jgi:hypothetical protein
MVKEFAAVYEIHNNVKMQFILEGILELHDERVVELLQYITLSYS